LPELIWDYRLEEPVPRQIPSSLCPLIVLQRFVQPGANGSKAVRQANIAVRPKPAVSAAFLSSNIRGRHRVGQLFSTRSLPVGLFRRLFAFPAMSYFAGGAVGVGTGTITVLFSI
jgi:hypothetical protein